MLKRAPYKAGYVGGSVLLRLAPAAGFKPGDMVDIYATRKALLVIPAGARIAIPGNWTLTMSDRKVASSNGPTVILGARTGVLPGDQFLAYDYDGALYLERVGRAEEAKIVDSE